MFETPSSSENQQDRSNDLILRTKVYDFVEKIRNGEINKLSIKEYEVGTKKYASLALAGFDLGKRPGEDDASWEMRLGGIREQIYEALQNNQRVAFEDPQGPDALTKETLLEGDVLDLDKEIAA